MATETTPQTVLSVLTQVRELLTPEGCWTQDAFGRDATGEKCPARSESCACWCLVGAIQAVCPSPSTRGAVYERLATVLGVAVDYSDSSSGDTHNDGQIIEWQDAPARTHAEVLAALDKAIEAESKA